MAAAWAVRLCEVDYVPAYPITPQTEIIETLAEWISDGEMEARFVTMDSEHSMITAAGAASATGARAFAATSSQGLLYGFEMLYAVAGWRVPLVMVNVSRGLSAPITLEPDHNDVLAARDSGFLSIFCETCQEVLDSVIMAFRVAEDERVLLPAMVNMDGFYLSFTREPVEIPDPEAVREFLPPYRPEHAFFRASRPMAQGVAVLGGAGYSYFKYQMHLASRKALEVYREVAGDFEAIFGRGQGTVEGHELEDADLVLVMAGSFSTLGKRAVSEARVRGIRAGLLRLRLLRPFPSEDVRRALRGKRAAAVIDQNISVGMGGILHSEVAAALYSLEDRPRLLSFIGGLGGKNISPREFEFIFDQMAKSEKEGGEEKMEGETAEVAAWLLYTEKELMEISNLKKIAGKEAEP